ncbi:MAG: cytochrome b/b6 domain-containing protein [Proteobacteria bacterium]|nr:cytochrome b/b6 domain-containing protein [Pseudomonadota bacterium]
MKKRKQPKKTADDQWILRFEPCHRITHVLVIVSFFTLAITGMALKFSYTGWAQFVARVLGGFETAGSLHRLAAVVTFGYFAMHIYFLRRERIDQKKDWFYGFQRPLPMYCLERPREYRLLKEQGTLEKYIVSGPSQRSLRTIYIFGLSALALGILLIALIAYSIIFIYR